MIAALKDGGHTTVCIQSYSAFPLKRENRVFCHVLSVNTREKTGIILELRNRYEETDSVDILGDTHIVFQLWLITRERMNSLLLKDVKTPHEIATQRYGWWSSFDLFVYPEYDELFSEPNISASHALWFDIRNSQTKESFFLLETLGEDRIFEKVAYSEVPAILLRHDPIKDAQNMRNDLDIQ